MAADLRIKICGLRDVANMRAAVDAGAAYVGLVFYPKSPRFVTLDEARAVAVEVPAGIVKVALVVDPENALLDEITAHVPIDMIQLHGHESPERVAEVRARYGLPVMKVVGVAGPDDLGALEAYGRVADQLMVDAKPAAAGDLPGGNGVPFDWRLIAGRRWPVPWMLAGGLNAKNVAEAVALTGARQIDLSSAVESAPGVKDPGLIAEFCAAALAD